MFFEKNDERNWCYHLALMVFINDQLFLTLLSLSDPFHATGHTAIKFAMPLLAPCDPQPYVAVSLAT